MDGDAYRNGKVHVCSRECDTCIFRPGNLMQLRSGRVREMVNGALDNDSAIICHSTLHGPNAVCRGFYDRYAAGSLPLRLAEPFGMLVWQEPEKL